MEKITQYLVTFSTGSAAIRLVLAFIFGGCIGMERGKRGRAAGLRTHILVCLGAAMASMTGLFVSEFLGFNSDPTRIAAQVISGIGFLGVGTILITGRSHVTGLTTAAGLWTTAAIGLALGMGFYSGAAVCTVISVLTIVALNSFENRVLKKSGTDMEIYIEISDPADVNKVVSDLTAGFDMANIEIKPARSGISGSLGIEAVVRLGKNENRREVCNRIAAEEGVTFAIGSI